MERRSYWDLMQKYGQLADIPKPKRRFHALRQVLARHLTLRHLADYAPEMVTYLQASRAVQRAQDLVAVIRVEVTSHAR